MRYRNRSRNVSKMLILGLLLLDHTLESIIFLVVRADSILLTLHRVT